MMIAIACIEPSKPWQNGVDEPFNGKLRHEYSTQAINSTASDSMASTRPRRDTHLVLERSSP